MPAVGVSYHFDENDLASRREVAEEFLARHAEEMARQMKLDMKTPELTRWRKFLAKVRKFCEKFVPRSYLNKLDDRTLTDIARRTLARAGYDFDAVRERSGDFGNGENVGRAALFDDKANFVSVLDDYQAGRLNRTKPIVVTSETPSIYLKLNTSDQGFRIFNRKITMPYSVIDKATGKIASTSTGDFHNVSLEKLKGLPDSLYNPVMVLHGSRNGTIEIYTQIFDDSNRPVMVVLEIDLTESVPSQKKGKQEDTYTVNSIRSIYGKDNANTAINKVKRGEFWYFNKKLAKEWCRAAGVQFPGAGDITLRLPYTIIDPGVNSTWIGKKIKGKLIWQRPGKGMASNNSHAAVTPSSKQRAEYLNKHNADNVAGSDYNSGSKSVDNITSSEDLSSPADEKNKYSRVRVGGTRRPPRMRRQTGRGWSRPVW